MLDAINKAWVQATPKTFRPIEQMAAKALEAKEAGYKTLKIKLGAKLVRLMLSA